MQAQSHFASCSNGAGNVFNATVIIPTASLPDIDGAPLPVGSEIAVFSQDNNLCVGVVTWNDASAALTVWGDDPLTSQVDGLQADEPLWFKFWDATTNTEYTDETVRVAYDAGNGQYSTDALYVLADLGVDTPVPGNPAIGEVGTIVKDQADSDTWHTVPLSGTYDNPVVILSMLTYNGSHPSTLRVRNVTASSFEFQIDEWDYLDGGHCEETIGYLVVEAGTHTLPNGRQLQAGLTDVGKKETRVTFASGFANAPVVVSQVVTTNDTRAVVTRQRNPTKNYFPVYLQGQESDKGHSTETVAWVAIEAGTGQAGDLAYEAAVTPDAVTHAWHDFSFDQSFPTPPVLLAAMQLSHGGDPAGLRLQNVTTAGLEVMIEEEQSKDNEMNHTTEAVGYLAFEAGPITAAPAASASVVAAKELSAENDALDTADFTEQPERYVLQQNYPNPFNPETVIRYDLAEQVPVRLDVYNALGQRVAVLVDRVQASGQHQATFDGASLPSGVYFYRLQAGSFEQTHTMILAK